jgi:hypothetical protein
VAGREDVAVRVTVSLGAEIGIALYDHGIVASFDVRVIDDRMRTIDEIEGVPIMAVENLDNSMREAMDQIRKVRR